MIQVVRKIDLENLKKINIPKAFRDYVERYFLEMTKRFSANDLSGIGTVFVIESAEDIEKYGLEAFLLKHPPCRVVGMTYLHFVKEARKKLQKGSLPCVETLPKTKGS